MSESQLFFLTLIRHAKSSWKAVGLTDHQRPVSKRGHSDIPLMLNKNSTLLSSIEHFYCSGAIRAQTIMDHAINILDIPNARITISDKYYTFNQESLLSSIREFPASQSSVALIGHNPALTDLINRLTDNSLLNLPTSGIARLRFNMNHWADITKTKGRLLYFDCPKNYR